MDFGTSKNLSAIGTLLMVIGVIPLIPYGAGGILALIGLILLLIGIKGLANYYNEQGIFSNVLYSVIIAIVGGVVAVAAVVTSALSALADIGIDLATLEDWANAGTEIGNVFTDITDLSAFMGLIGAVLVGLVILFVVLIISMYFSRKSMNQLSSKSGIGLFGTAGLLMLIGAVLSIIVIGFVIIWIGLILAMVGFFQLKPE
jgi:uncharacterized membrane protein